MRTRSYRKPLIDVMENVFGGLHISTDEETRGRAMGPDLGPRPWLSGLTMSDVQVRLSHDDDSEADEPPKR